MRCEREVEKGLVVQLVSGGAAGCGGLQLQQADSAKHASQQAQPQQSQLDASDEDCLSAACTNNTTPTSLDISAQRLFKPNAQM